MLDTDVESVAARYPGTLAIQSKAPGLYYFAHPDDPKRMVIAAEGKILLTRKQIATLVKELPDVAELYCKE